MVTTEFEEQLDSLSDAQLMRLAIKHLREVYMRVDEADQQEESQEVLDFIYMECSKRGKEWIFDKAQDACLRQGNAVCPVPSADHDGM